MDNPGFIPQFEEAQRLQCNASIMIEGLPGKGKTGLALIIAKVLTGSWENIAVIDAENKSANLFVDINSTLGEVFGKFKVAYLTSDIGYKPTNYLFLRKYAIEKLQAKAVVKDSISHAWMYQGGILDILNEAKKTNSRYAKDPYAAWADDEVSAEKNRLLDLIRHPECHVITTVRVKEKFEYTKEGDKTVLKSLGEQQIQQADLKYEPDLVLHMVCPGKVRNGQPIHPTAKVIKSRYAILDEGEEYTFSPELIKQLRDYLQDGADPNELVEKQRQDYIQAIKDHLDTHQQAVPIWKVLKKDAGYENTPLEDIPLEVVKTGFIKLTSN